jgi:TusA-related sulfurtransferase
MSQVTTVDGRGLSCPLPALRAQDALKQMASGTVEVLVDSGTSCDNVTRIAQRAGWTVEAEEQPEGTVKLVLKK